MELVVNGAPRTFPPGVRLAEVVAAVSGQPAGIAVALNGAVVSRGQWEATDVRDGDVVEVVTAMQGG